MSLVAFAIRIATVRAIEAVIWPEFEVRDSPQAPLDLLEDGTALIAVYTGHNNDKMDGRDMFGGDPRVQLTLQVFLPTTVTITVAGQPLNLDTKDAGAETVLDVIARRITGAVLSEANPWSQLLLALIQKTARTANNSYLVETGGVRTSAREIILDCSVLHEPIPGAPPTDVWQELIALMSADTGPRSFAPLASWIAAEIAGPATLSQAERDRIDMGLSEYAARRVGIVLDVEDVDDGAPGPTTAIDEISADPDAPAPDGYQVTP